MFKKQHAPKTILIAEDDSSIGAMLLELIKSELPYPGVLVTDGLLALEVVSPIQPVLFLFNYWLPGMNGIQLYDHLHHMEGLEDVPTIMLSAALPHDELKERRIVGIEKPFDIDSSSKPLKLSYLLTSPKQDPEKSSRFLKNVKTEFGAQKR